MAGGISLGFGSDPAERRRRETAEAERRALNLLPGLLTPVDDARDIPRLPKRNTDTPEFPESHIPQDPDRRAFKRQPTAVEMLSRLAETQTPDDGTRAALVALATGVGMRLPKDAEVPGDIKDALEASNIAHALVQGRHVPPEQAEVIGRTAAQLGMRPSLDAMLPPRPRPLSPSQQRVARTERADEDFRARVEQNEWDLNTPAGRRAAMLEAQKTGAEGEYNRLRGMWRDTRDLQTEEAQDRARTTIVPGYQQKFAEMAKHKTFTPQDQATFDGLIEAYEAEPSPRNKAAVDRFFSAMPNELEQRGHRQRAMTERVRQYEGRIALSRQRVDLAVENVNKGDLKGAATIVRQEIVDLRRQVRDAQREMELAGPEDRVRLQSLIDTAQDRADQLQDWQSRVAGSLAGEGKEPPAREDGAGRIDMDAITKKLLEKHGIGK